VRCGKTELRAAGKDEGWVSRKYGETRLMTKLTSLVTIAILSVAFSPAFAQDASGRKAIYQGQTYDQQNFRRAYNRMNGPADSGPVAQEGWSLETFGFRGRDPSWVGGQDPSLNPAN